MFISPLGNIPPASPINTVTPFTYRDNDTYLTILERLRTNLNLTIDYINDVSVNNTSEINAAITALTATLNATLAASLDTINANSATLAEMETTLGTLQTTLTAQQADNQSMLDQLNTLLSTVNADLADRYTKSESDALLNGKVPKGSAFINVKDYGAVGDGLANDKAAINNALTAGATANVPVYIPGGTYLVDLDDAWDGAIKMSTANTHLVLARDCEIKAIGSSQTLSCVIKVTAPDCSVRGGLLTGDLLTHIGTDGEWGMCLALDTGSDRFFGENIRTQQAWGDGIYVWGEPGPTGVVLNNVSADSCRRQGMSIESCTNMRVNGGLFTNTGVLGATSPSAGIDIEPQPNKGGNVVDLQLTNVISKGNVGSGLLVASQTATSISASIDGINCIGNGENGIRAVNNGGTMSVNVRNFSAKGSTGSSTKGYGILVQSGIVEGSIAFENGTVEANNNIGVRFDGPSVLRNVVVKENQLHGVVINGANSDILSCLIKNNGRLTDNTYSELSLQAAGCSVMSTVCRPATTGNKTSAGMTVAAAATSGAVLGCKAFAGGTSTFSNSGAIMAFPHPGNTVTAQVVGNVATDAATTQSLANLLRTALINLGGAKTS